MKSEKKIKPGVSTFADRPEEVGPEHLEALLDHARNVVPEDQRKDTPIFVMATAGVRLLEPRQQKTLLDSICAYARTHTDFALPDCDLHIQVIPGETEGLYGWIAANYLLGGFDRPAQHRHGDGHHTYGFLDMGGASAQIAFAPNATEAEKHANDLKLLRMRTLNGESAEYKVFTATWLGFGVNQARERYVEALMASTNTKSAHELPDPCLPSGLRTTLEGQIPEAPPTPDPVLVGTGRFDECLRQTFPLLDKDAPCADPPCLLHGQHVPAIDFDVNHFVGVSEYWHTTHEVFDMGHKDRAYDFTTYQARVKDFCSEEWHDIEEGVADKKWGKKVDAKTAQEVCFKASWLINVLHDGIGIPRTGVDKNPGPGYNGTREIAPHRKDRGFLDPFQAVHKIEGMEVSWTLGKMVLYASGQIPPAAPDAGPVGFGTNLIHTDFQEAGSHADPAPVDEADSWSDAVEEISEQAHARSMSVFLFFLLVLVGMGYFFRKRDRRTRLYRSFQRRHRRPGSPRKSGRGFFSAGKIWGSRHSTAHYDRVLEDGEAAAEFELGDVDSADDNDHSDSSGSNGSRLGRTSGLATPKMAVMNFDLNHYFETPPAPEVGGVGKAFDRAGLVVRTESRERLVPTLQMLGAGRRSRAGSPTRKSPLMMPLGED